MTAIVEHMDADTAAAAEPQPPAPLVLDDASLERLAALVWARRPPARSPWQTSLLVMLAGALIAAATAGYFSLRGDIAALGTSLRAEMASLETGLRAEMASREESLRADMTALGTSLRAEMASLEENLRADMASLEENLRADMASLEESLRAELREFRAEFNMVARDHTQRLARLEAAHPHSAAG